MFVAFDLLHQNGESTAQLPLIERKERLKRLFKKEIQGLRYNEHVTGDGPRFREHACKLGLEGVISKRADRPYAPGDRGIWVKSKCLKRGVRGRRLDRSRGKPVAYRRPAAGLLHRRRSIAPRRSGGHRHGLAPRQVARAPGAAPPPSRDRPGLSPFLNEIGQNAGLSQPAASEEAAFCCSTGTAFRSGRTEHRKQ